MPHNGGRVQAGSAGAFSNDFPFVDFFKGGQGWSGSPNWVNPAWLDADGWPNTLGGGSMANRMNVPTRLERPGLWCIDWQGNGTLSLNGGALESGYSLTSSSGSGLVKFHLNSDATRQIDVGINSLATKITNIRVYHEDDTSIVGTQIFNSWFIDYLRTFGVLRFMGLMDSPGISGQSNLTTWALRKPLSYANWSGPEHRAGLIVTASYALNGSSNDYSATFGTGGPVDKETIMFVVPETATTNTITFNKNGTGAVPVINSNGSAISSSSQRLDKGSGKVATLIYHEGFGAYTLWGGSINTGATYIMNGWPVEIQMLLLKLTEAHGYWNFPHLCFDPISDYPASMASYAKAYAKSNGMTWFVPRFSGPNETWNNVFIQTAFADARQRILNGVSLGALTVTGFSSTGVGVSGTSKIIATGGASLPLGACVTPASFGGLFGFGFPVFVTAKNPDGDNVDEFTVNRAPTGGSYTSGGTVTGASNDRHSWYGTAMADLGQAVAGVYAVAKADVQTQQNYQVICEVQTLTVPSSSDQRLLSTQNAIVAGKTASDWVNYIAMTQYVSPTDRGYASEVGRSWQYNQGDLTQPRLYVDGLAGSSLTPATLGYLSAAYTSWKSWVLGFVGGPRKMCGYEGNYSPDFKATGTTVSCTITGATKDATGCVLTVSNGSVESGWVAATLNPNGCFDTNCVGLTFTIASVGGMTQLNGLTATIVSVNGNQIKTNIDSSGFSTYTSGGAATVVNGRQLINDLRYAGKFDPQLTIHMLNNLYNFVGLTSSGFVSEFPSMFLWSSSSAHATTGVIGDGAGIWGLRDPSIFNVVSPQVDAIKLFDARLRRKRLVASI